MRLTFWGTRGSLAKPGPSTVRYGGNTSCVQFESDSGTLIVLDCGTGAHGLGMALAQAGQAVHGNLLIGHTHWDHIQGIPFFGPLYVPGNRWECYAPRGFGKSLHETLSGQMEYTYFPVGLEALAADVHYTSLVEGVFEVGDVMVRTRYLNHPALTVGFRLEVDGVAVVYACDHEQHGGESASGSSIEGPDRQHAEFLRDADLVIHDAQYTTEEYPDKVGWGHSTHEYAVAVCRAAGVKQLALTHHDPLRSDDELDRILERLRQDLDRDGADLELCMAAEGQVIELRGDAPRTAAEGQPSALREAEPIGGQPVLLGLPAGGAGDIIRQAIAEDGLEAVPAASVDELSSIYQELRPPLVMVGAGFVPEGADALASALDLAWGDADYQDGDLSDKARLLVVEEATASDGKNPEAAMAGRLTMPFSVPYARTRIRAALTRTRCRWVAPPRPEDELDRQVALEALQILDTPAEDRFDRLTRLASAALDAPVALVTLIDNDRQWFKSRQGTELGETHREMSFCGHAILRDEPLIVPDALLDDRFADNPAVTGDLRVRFYAGQPIHAPGGHRIGTLCVIDTRPRQPTPQQLAALRDLAQLVEQELKA